MSTPRPDKADEFKTCSKCGKRVAVESKIGSLTGRSRASIVAVRAAQALKVGNAVDSNDFCRKCGLAFGHDGQEGSISGFLFQDIRCKW